LPFRQSAGPPDTANIGAGIAASITNALKTIPTLTVADTSLIESASKADSKRDLASDDDAIAMGAN
jgi:hypothetical protein